MGRKGLSDLFKAYVQGTAERSIVPSGAILLCNVSFAAVRGAKLSSSKAYITCRALKHLYDQKPAEEFEFLLEHMESFAECAKREAMEEAGIEIDNVRFLCLSNFKEYAPKHYVDIGLIADWKSGTPEVFEPEKCEGWGWYDLDDLPDPLFGIVKNYAESMKTGKSYFDE